MRFAIPIALTALLGFFVACSDGGKSDSHRIERIAFGSCLHQDRPAPIWKAIIQAAPEAWVWLGDNVYGDSDELEVLATAYGKVSAHPDYKRLKETTQILGTWDDHDFGKNNGGKEWEGKAVAQKALLDFLEEPVDSPRRKQVGVYASYLFGSGDQQVKVLLLDVRSHRDDPALEGGDIFGEEQRAWIETELADNEAALTVFASGTQVIPEEHRFEKWYQFPEAQAWFFEQIVKYDTGAVLFLSGDRHSSEFSQRSIEGRSSPIYEVTSSSLTHARSKREEEPNRFRVGEMIYENNFGLLEIDWDKRSVRASICDEAGKTLGELSFDI